MVFLSTPSARRATHRPPQGDQDDGISIHALREEGDTPTAGRPANSRKFLSTPSARRATASGSCARASRSNFYPRPPRGGRHLLDLLSRMTNEFLSTPSARRATWHRPCPRLVEVISIHALREEGDPLLPSSFRSSCHFYPRPPRGGRPSPIFKKSCDFEISIHALREEGDDLPVPERRCMMDFYPRPPRGGRHAEAEAERQAQIISIHALREEGDVTRYSLVPR